MFENHTLNPAQEAVARHGILSSGFNSVLQLPTGTGKTWLAERAIESTLKLGGKAVYLTPLRALADELLKKWSSTFSSHEVGVFTGEYGNGRKFPVPFADAQLLIMTPERLDACTRQWRRHWSWIPDVDLIIVDELHLLGEPGRGPKLEGALMRIRRLNPFAKIVGLSATLGNRQELANWLEGVELKSDWRATPVSWRIRKFGKATDKPQILVDEVQSCVSNGGQSLVFVQSRRRAEQLAKILSESGIESSHHHAGLNKDERLDVETKYRTNKLKALISTGTLEMGLNLPARQVVLFDLQRFDGMDFVPLSVNTVWQRGGRAGRQGLDKEGEIVLISPAWDRQTERYLKGKFEDIKSRLIDDWSLAEQLLAEVGSGMSKHSTQLERAFGNSLASHQGVSVKVRETTKAMLDSGMLKEHQSEYNKQLLLRPTKLGRIAIRQLLTPNTVLQLATHLTADYATRLSFFDLLLLAASTRDCGPKIPVDFEEIDQISQLLSAETSWFLSQGLEFTTKELRVSGKALLTILKTALVARKHTRSDNPEEVAESFGCYQFEVQRLAESMERILTAASAITMPPKPDPYEETKEVEHEIDEEPSLFEKINALKSMVSYGMDETAVSLTFIPGIGGKIAKRLFQAGIEDIEDLALACDSQIAEVRGISKTRAKRLIEEAEGLIDKRSSFAFKEFGPGLQIKESDWIHGVDPYRLRRAIDLKVATGRNNSYTVSGGLEPHQVDVERKKEFNCDCADFAKGNGCKHIFAVRLHKGDEKLTALTRKLGGKGPQIDLLQLWLSTGEAQ